MEIQHKKKKNQAGGQRLMAEDQTYWRNGGKECDPKTSTKIQPKAMESQDKRRPAKTAI